MRVLEPQMIIDTAILMSLLMAICVVNLNYFVRRRRTVLSALLHVASFFGLISIFCQLMVVVILSGPIENIFRQVGIGMLTASVFVLVSLSCVYLILKKRARFNFHVSPDLKAVFNVMDDVALIVDYQGVITEINHPEKLDLLLDGHCKTVDAFKEKLKQKTSLCNQQELEARFENIKGQGQFEIHFLAEVEDYLFTITPILTGKSALGYTLVMENITGKKRFEQQIMAHNAFLEEANRKLVRDADIAHGLEVEKARLRLLEPIQMALIDKIEKAIAQVRQIQKNSHDSMASYQKEIAQVTDRLRDVYKDVRKSIQIITDGERV